MSTTTPNPEQQIKYSEAQATAEWFNANTIDGGVIKAPYDSWQPDKTANPQPDDMGEWLIDTNGTMADDGTLHPSTGISAWMINDRRAKYGEATAIQMTKDEFEKD